MNLRFAAAALAASVMVLAGAAGASPLSDAKLRYKQDRAACMNGTSNQDRATCLKEASAALAEAKRGGLASGDLARNRIARCDNMPAQDRQACETRMNSGTTSGSAQQGGILRESTEVVPKR